MRWKRRGQNWKLITWWFLGIVATIAIIGISFPESGIVQAGLAQGSKMMNRFISGQVDPTIPVPETDKALGQLMKTIIGLHEEATMFSGCILEWDHEVLDKIGTYTIDMRTRPGGGLFVTPTNRAGQVMEAYIFEDYDDEMRPCLVGPNGTGRNFQNNYLEAAHKDDPPPDVWKTDFIHVPYIFTKDRKVIFAGKKYELAKDMIYVNEEGGACFILQDDHFNFWSCEAYDDHVAEICVNLMRGLVRVPSDKYNQRDPTRRIELCKVKYDYCCDDCEDRKDCGWEVGCKRKECPEKPPEEPGPLTG
ncbi:MAG: hypothetical protein ABIC95_01150 [archaeon]